MTGQFDDELTLPANGGVIKVKGPLMIDSDANFDGDIKSAEIHFIIVQGKGEKAVTAVGQGHWERDQGDEWTADLRADKGKLPNGDPGTFRTDVQEGSAPDSPRGLARGIALAIAIKPGKVVNGTFVPPAYQTLTWCADFKFVPETAA